MLYFVGSHDSDRMYLYHEEESLIISLLGSEEEVNVRRKLQSQNIQVLDLVKDGFLLKRAGKFFKTWEEYLIFFLQILFILAIRRYVKLFTHGQLLYFEDETQTLLKGSYDLSRATDINTKEEFGDGTQWAINVVFREKSDDVLRLCVPDVDRIISAVFAVSNLRDIIR